MMTPEELVARASFLRMPAVALTDRWTTYGHYEFYKLAKAAGIKPLLGAEIKHLSLTGDGGIYHLTLLAENNSGYRNLTALLTKHYEKENNIYVTKDELLLHRDGLIVLTGCIRGETNQAILHDNTEKEKEVVEILLGIFGRGNVFLEIMNHNRKKEQLVLDKMAVLSGKLKVPMVVTNNDRFAEKDQAVYYSLLRALDGGDEPGEDAAIQAEYFLKKKKDLDPFFYVVSDALEESGKIAERCNVELDCSGRIIFFGEADSDDALAEECKRMFLLKYRGRKTDEIKQRRKELQDELESASRERLSGFLLFLRSLILGCQGRGIRLEMMGSEILESCIANLLGIVPLDPVSHGLVFESFNSSGPGIPPQIELFKPAGTRVEFSLMLERLLSGHRIVYQVVREETSIVTLVRELADVLGVEQELGEEIASIVSSEKRKISLHGLLEYSERLTWLYNENNVVKKILHTSFALHGRVHHFILNTSRLVVLPRKVDREVMFMMGGEDERFAALDNNAVIQLGGWVLVVQRLHFLTAIERAIRIIGGKPRSTGTITKSVARAKEMWDPVSLNDQETFKLISRGDTTGVYLLESKGIRELLVRIGPDNFDELVNVISLYRPAPLEGRLWQKYLENSERGEKALLPHHSMSAPLEKTRGILLYREQVREILRCSALLTGENAIIVENALRKQETGDLLNARLRFIRGSMENGIDEKNAQKIFDFLLHHIKFTYDKAFSCSQAYISYRTAFLKAHYMDEYFAALLNSTSDVRDRQKKYLDYLDHIRKKVFPADINSSSMEFITESGGIRAPLNYSNTLDDSDLEKIIADRNEKGEFRLLEEFFERMSSELPMSSVNDIIDAGLFEFLMIKHSDMKKESLKFYEKHARAGGFFRSPPQQVRSRKDKTSRQLSFMDDEDW